MSKADLGKKLTCPSCGARFYNLNKNPAPCPKCETMVEAQPILKPRRQSAAEKAKAAPVKAAPKPAKSSDDEDDDDLLEDDDDLDIEDDDDDLIEDTADLDDDDDDDVSEVKEHIEPTDRDDSD